MKRAVFLDRDGVINRRARDHEYVKTWEEFQFLPLAREAIRLLSGTDLLLIIITNQRGLAKGIMSQADLKLIHDNMRVELERAGGRIDHIFYCPHDIQRKCNCRKPEIGLFLRARDVLGIDLKQSYLAGDSMADIEAGAKAGCKETILINPDGTYLLESCSVKPSKVVKSLYEAAVYTLENTL